MGMSIYFSLHERTGKVQLRRRNWDGIDRPEHETIYTVETVEEADHIHARLGEVIESAKEREKEFRQQRIEALKLKIAQLTKEREDLEREMNNLTRP